MPPRRLRLDAELVRRGLARSREHASELIAAGRVSVNKAVATKPATGVTTDADLVVREDPDDPDYASRGGAQARRSARGLHARSASRSRAGGAWTPAPRRAGSPTCCCGQGAARWSPSTWATASWCGRCSNDPRVRVHDRTNIREIDTDLIGGPVDLVVGDLSFISLELVLDALIGVTAPDGDLVLMVKPQFEVGKERLGKGGVVRDLGHRADAVDAVAAGSGAPWLGGPRGRRRARCPGPSGNVEFFVWLRAGEPRDRDRDAIEAEVARSADLGVPGEKVNP